MESAHLALLGGAVMELILLGAKRMSPHVGNQLAKSPLAYVSNLLNDGGLFPAATAGDLLAEKLLTRVTRPSDWKLLLPEVRTRRNSRLKVRIRSSVAFHETS